MSIRSPRFVHVPVDESRLLNGVKLFNAGKYFESHEVWESLWHEVAKPERDLLQGLIQVAAAYYHLTRHNLPGARYLYARGRARLIRWMPEHAGLVLDAFVRDVDAVFTQVIQDPTQPFRKPRLYRRR